MNHNNRKTQIIKYVIGTTINNPIPLFFLDNVKFNIVNRMFFLNDLSIKTQCNLI